ncbi:hypothetical protein [Streptomyces sp. NPDC048425]|uniref:hypothetical protein n=1 Tax=Streptomyces sp. NPDC048425 TaxID=3365548 RepID=UPI003718E1FF
MSLQNDSSGVDLGAQMEAEEQGDQEVPGRATAAQVHELPKQRHQGPLLSTSSLAAAMSGSGSSLPGTAWIDWQAAVWYADRRNESAGQRTIH